jgi:2-oxo-3-hexenedioate decarboxylase/2-keto-4-pentenoate hydratase
MTDAVRLAAERLAAARIARERLPGLPDDLRPTDEATAYRVQDALHGMLTARGFGPLTGHKIGCTTAVMQKFLGIDHPCAGGVFATRVFRQSVALPFDSFLHVGVETEIAVVLGRDLPPRGEAYSVDEVRAAVSAIAAAIEIVDDRWVDYKCVDAPTMIADDFFNDASVLGPLRPFDRTLDLGALRGTTRIGGSEVGRGVGADVLGHPVNALAWLANHLAARGPGLRAGEFVTTGSVVETKWMRRGDAVVVEIEGLGTVRAVFG